MNPAVWLVLGVLVGLLLGYDWSDPTAFKVDIDPVFLGALAGGFVTVIVAAWPRLRKIPDVPCPRCGHRMQWDVVVCPNCGEIR